MNVTPADVLERAAEILETEEWCQGVEEAILPNGGKAYCAVGAMDKAVRMLHGLNGLHWKVLDETTSILCGAINDYGRKVFNIPLWNDSSLRTKDQVIDAMKHAAKEYRNVH